MRVIRDGFVHIDKDGQRIHTKVRAVQDDHGRLAVFLSPSSGPAHVYNLAEVQVTKTSASCSHPVCYGKVNRQRLARMWEQSEAAHAV